MITELFIKESTFNLSETTRKMQISNVWENSNFNFANLFIAHFNYLPNSIGIRRIDCSKLLTWLEVNYKTEIKDFYFYSSHSNKNTNYTFHCLCLFLYEDLVIRLDTDRNNLYKKTNQLKIDSFIQIIQKFKLKKMVNRPDISLIVNGDYGIETKSIEISKNKLNIDDNYNSDFKDIHKNIFKRLSLKNDKGLVLLHGKPGTGKTSYIRYLIASLKKQVIFLPPDMATIITNPAFISFLLDNPNSVLVIEDAENIVIDRENDGNSSVSALLNISDGLLSDCLNIQIICTFNTDISKIDSALMRKGRLIAKYEFKELEIEKAQALSDKIGFKTIVNEPMSLASIYNQDENFFQQPKRNPIGYKVVNKNLNKQHLGGNSFSIPNPKYFS